MIGAMCELSLQLKPEQCSDVTGGAMIVYRMVKFKFAESP